jgi:EAL domain-containing protein (putative c-di-GMP-specific phosphodiesterase class I)
MLVHVAQLLRKNADGADFVARIGGDEFVVICVDGPNAKDPADLAQRLVDQGQQPILYENHECRFGISVGIVVGNSRSDVQQMMINADIALYRAKSRGRNRLEFFSSEMQAQIVRTKRVADEILSGLERDEFVAWYQPQFNARTKELAGVEALARWQHPTEGLLAPAAFIDVAEDLNVLAKIDRIILEQTLEQLRIWDRLGLRVPHASVNVSGRRLHDDTLIEGLKTLDIEPGRIAFEFVESIYLDKSDDIVSWNIDQIRDLGIDIELDDFGTGYASVISLMNLRPSRLKIDRQLVMPIVESRTQRQLVRSIIDIGKALGMEVVGEGVESQAHADVLRDLGCDYIQGFAFARPMRASDLEGFLMARAWRVAG